MTTVGKQKSSQREQFKWFPRLETKLQMQMFVRQPYAQYTFVWYHLLNAVISYACSLPGRSAFIGIGFGDRGDAFDFNVALQDHFKYVYYQSLFQLCFIWLNPSLILLHLIWFSFLISRWVKQETEFIKQAQAPDSTPKLDLGFKEGQTITLNIGVTLPHYLIYPFLWLNNRIRTTSLNPRPTVCWCFLCYVNLYKHTLTQQYCLFAAIEKEGQVSSSKFRGPWASSTSSWGQVSPTPIVQIHQSYCTTICATACRRKWNRLVIVTLQSASRVVILSQ